MLLDPKQGKINWFGGTMYLQTCKNKNLNQCKDYSDVWTPAHRKVQLTLHQSGKLEVLSYTVETFLQKSNT